MQATKFFSTNERESQELWGPPASGMKHFMFFAYMALLEMRLMSLDDDGNSASLWPQFTPTRYTRPEFDEVNRLSSRSG